MNQQLAFLREIDQLKSVVRQSPLLDRTRKENSAEHSWHLAVYAIVLQQYSAAKICIERLVQMLLIHDIVEVDVGDNPIHKTALGDSQALLEERAATRIFGMIPGEQGAKLLALWREFELAESNDARFAKAPDSVQPLLVNISTRGGTWADNGVTLEQIIERYDFVISQGSPSLWAACEALVREHFASQSAN